MTLVDGTYSFRGLVFGLGTDYPLALPHIDGLEGFEARSGDVDLPRGHGSIPGQHFRAAAQMLAPFVLHGDRETVEAKMAILRDTFQVSEDTQFDLEFKKQGQPQRLIRCRPTGFARGDTPSGLVAAPKVALIAADPRIYSSEVVTTIVPLYSPAGGGIDAPVNAPVNVSAGVQVETTVTNDGTADANPTVRFYGPFTEVVLTNVTTGDTLTVETTATAGQVLTYDGGAFLTGEHVVSLDGAGRYADWQERLPFVLPPGTSTLRFQADDAAQAVVTHQHTWLS